MIQLFTNVAKTLSMRSVTRMAAFSSKEVRDAATECRAALFLPVPLLGSFLSDRHSHLSL